MGARRAQENMTLPDSSDGSFPSNVGPTPAKKITTEDIISIRKRLGLPTGRKIGDNPEAGLKARRSNDLTGRLNDPNMFKKSQSERNLLQFGNKRGIEQDDVPPLDPASPPVAGKNTGGNPMPPLVKKFEVPEDEWDSTVEKELEKEMEKFLAENRVPDNVNQAPPLFTVHVPVDDILLPPPPPLAAIRAIAKNKERSNETRTNFRKGMYARVEVSKTGRNDVFRHNMPEMNQNYQGNALKSTSRKLRYGGRHAGFKQRNTTMSCRSRANQTGGRGPPPPPGAVRKRNSHYSIQQQLKRATTRLSGLSQQRKLNDVTVNQDALLGGRTIGIAPGGASVTGSLGFRKRERHVRY